MQEVWMFHECKDQTQNGQLSYWKMGQRCIIMETSFDIKSIVQERGNRIEELIRDGRYEDAIAIGEEFDEWIRNLVS